MSEDTRVIDPYLIVRISDNPARYIGAGTLGHIIRTPKEAMLLVKMRGKEIEEPAVTLGRIFQALSLGTVADAIAEGGHSTELQTWLAEQGYDVEVPDDEEVEDEGEGGQDDVEDLDSTLFELVNNSLVKLPQTLQDLGSGLFMDVLSQLPTGQAQYTIDHLMQVSKFGLIGTVKTILEYEQDTTAAVVLDCSGSMGTAFGQAVAGAVVDLADSLKCDLILVSTTAVRLPAGTFSRETVMRNWQSGWTFYNQLIPYFKRVDQSYDVVVSIADYDSHAEHKAQIKRDCGARIQTLYDINVQFTEDEEGNLRTSYLAECLGQLADRVVPVFVGAPGLSYSR